MPESQLVKYKVCYLIPGRTLDEAHEQYVFAAQTPKDVNGLIVDEMRKGYVYVSKRAVGDWGWQLFFREKAPK